MSSVSQQLSEFQDLSSRVRTELQALERISMMGAAAGERYPLLLDVQEKLDEQTPKIEALAREVGIVPSPEEGGRAAQSALARGDSGSNKALEQLEKDLTSNLDYLRSIPGLVPSSSASKEPEGEGEGGEGDEEEELSEEAKAIAASFERMLGHKPHPSEVAYGMIPDAKTKAVWKSIPMARPPQSHQGQGGGAAAGDDEHGGLD